jgi:hypothetical protein
VPRHRFQNFLQGDGEAIAKALGAPDQAHCPSAHVRLDLNVGEATEDENIDHANREVAHGEYRVNLLLGFA